MNTQEGNDAGGPALRGARVPAPPRGPGRAPPRPRRGLLVPRRRARRAGRARRRPSRSALRPAARAGRREVARRRRAAAASSWCPRRRSRSPGEPFVATVRLDGVPGDGSVALDVHQRIRSRSELAQSMEGDGLRCCVFNDGRPAVRPARPARRHPAGRAARSTPPPAACPSPPRASTRSSSPRRTPPAPRSTTLVTHLIVPPEDGDDAPNLAVARGRRARRAARARSPTARSSLDRADVDDLGALVAGLAAAPDVPATLSVRPETVEALLASPEPGDAELVAAMRAAAAGRTVLAEPYVAARPRCARRTPTCSVRSARSRTRGDRGPRRRARWRRPTTPCSWRRPRSAPTGSRVLAFTGTTGWSSTTTHLEPLADGIISYSLAQPFVVAVPEASDVDDRTPGAGPGAGARPDRDGAPRRRRVARAWS